MNAPLNIVLQRNLYDEGATKLAAALQRVYKVDIEIRQNEHKGKGFYDPSLKMLVAVGFTMPITEMEHFIKGYIAGACEAE